MPCNGGFLDTIDFINGELAKEDKEKRVIGFERDRKNSNRIRFFDKNNRTVWLSDNFYKKMNIAVIRMGGLKAGRVESNRWKEIASGQCSVFDRFNMKFNQLTNTIAKKLSEFLRE